MMNLFGRAYNPNHKWFRDLAISAVIVEAMEDMNMRMPAPTVDLDQIRQLYHAAAAEMMAGSHEGRRKRR